MKNIFSNKKAIIVLIVHYNNYSYYNEVTFFKPKPILKLRLTLCIQAGSRSEYPDNDQSRYYIEFKDNKTFILMYDDNSEELEENYDEDT